MDAINIEDAAVGYITAALWADCACSCDEPCDCEPGGREQLTVAAEDRAYIRQLVETFVERHSQDCAAYVGILRNHTEYTASERLGHDLRLSSGGHGAGFFDRGLGALGDRLQDAAQATPFTRIGGGDVWDAGDGTARFDHLS